MKPKVDTGDIISVKRFTLYPMDTVYSLTQRCYGYILTLFYDIVSLILNNQSLPKSQEKWTRKPYTRKELNELCQITQAMSKEEIKKRIKALTFPNMPGVYTEIEGIKFILK